MALWLLIIQVISGGDSLTQATMNMSLKEVLQEYVVCRKEFEEHQREFEEATTIEGPTQRQLSLERLRLKVLAKCGVRP
ncbi:MAG: hypothetical protein ACRD2L_25255 [Terriglobia bacterium]